MKPDKWALEAERIRRDHDPKVLAPMRFVVEWDDWEGIRHELTFPEAKYEDALLEADALKKKYDYVNIRAEQ